ncbi:MAG: hypothetical protein R6V76_13995, partial [Desulfobacterales bacterium]
HFFAFLVAVWGELSPPTSLAAAVAARIADASFMKTMWQALKMCLPITIMTFAIFVRTDMVINPGWKQILDTLLISIGCCGIAFTIFGMFVRGKVSNTILRVVLCVASIVILFNPNQKVAIVIAALVLPAVIYGVIRHRIVAPPKIDPQTAA